MTACRNSAREVRAVDEGAAAGAAHRHDDARRAPVAVRHAHAQPRHAGHRAVLRAHGAAACSRSNAGAAPPSTWPALPQGRPWERLARLRAAVPNILFQMLLRASTRSATPTTATTWSAISCSRRRRRRRPVPRLRFAELGGQHARGDGCGDRNRCAVRRHHLLHRRFVRCQAAEIQPQVLRRSGEAAGEGRRPHHRHQGHGRRSAKPRAARELVGR